LHLDVKIQFWLATKENQFFDKQANKGTDGCRSWAKGKALVRDEAPKDDVFVLKNA